ncbi:MAG: hypothetical protein IT431_15700 [Phycisphaerales bacterium]|nr:hypothetical protein [Phycisphaerales bacterium]
MWQPNETYWGVLIAANIPVYLGIGKVLFDDWHGVLESVRYYFTPDFFSALRGEWGADTIAEFKLVGFLVLSGLAVVGEHFAMAKLGWVGG